DSSAAGVAIWQHGRLFSRQASPAPGLGHLLPKTPHGPRTAIHLFSALPRADSGLTTPFSRDAFPGIGCAGSDPRCPSNAGAPPPPRRGAVPPAPPAPPPVPPPALPPPPPPPPGLPTAATRRGRCATPPPPSRGQCRPTGPWGASPAGIAVLAGHGGQAQEAG